jgi:hypothetical protein
MSSVERAMCVHCGHPHFSDPLGFCLACSIEIRRDFYAGLERLTVYLASWAAFEEWEAEHPGGLDETSSVPPEAHCPPQRIRVQNDTGLPASVPRNDQCVPRRRVTFRQTLLVEAR